jgi:hypothetical protein
MDERRHEFTAILYSGQKATADGLGSEKQPNDSDDCTKKTILREVWFPGNHGDVGGSIPFDRRYGQSLANHSFRWIIRAAAISDPENSLLFDFDALQKYYAVLFHAPISRVQYRVSPMSMWFLSRLRTPPFENCQWSQSAEFMHTHGTQLIRNQRPDEDLKNPNSQSNWYRELCKCRVSQGVGMLWRVTRLFRLNWSGRPRCLPEHAQVHCSAYFVPDATNAQIMVNGQPVQIVLQEKQQPGDERYPVRISSLAYIHVGTYQPN